MNADPAVLLELFKGLASLACATVDGKVLSYPVVTFHEEYAEQLEACRTEKKNAVFLLSDEQVAKLLVPSLSILSQKFNRRTTQRRQAWLSLHCCHA